MKIKTYIFLIIVASSLTSVNYHRIRHCVLEGPHPEYKVNSFLSLASNFDTFKQHQKYYWKARIFSCLNSGLFARIFGLRHGYKQPAWFCNVIAADCCIWLFLTFLCIIIFSHNPLLMILGTGAALQYSFLPLSEGQINPWDMQSLFWWYLVLLVNNTKYKHYIVYMIPVGALYKEIIVILSILILFWDDYSFKRRVFVFFIVSGIGIAFKIIQGCLAGCNIIGNQSFRYDYNAVVKDYVCRTGEKYIWQRNLHSLLWWRNFNPIYFSIAGLWLGFILLPIPTPYRVIALVYCCTVFIPGNTTEGRLWHELIPVFFVGYEKHKKVVSYEQRK